jgi:hypothetical protein
MTDKERMDSIGKSVPLYTRLLIRSLTDETA